MPKLENTKIMRSSPSSDTIREEENQDCHINAQFDSEMITFSFKLKVAGNGVSQIWVNINKDAFPVILEEIAKATPDAATLFSKCSSIALELNKKHKEIDPSSLEGILRGRYVENYGLD